MLYAIANGQIKYINWLDLIVFRYKKRNSEERPRAMMIPMATAPASDYTVDSASGKITHDAQVDDGDDYINLQEPQMKALPSVSQAVDDNYAYVDMPRPPDLPARPDETFAMYETPKGDDVSSPSTFKPNNTPIINKNRMTLMPQ